MHDTLTAVAWERRAAMGAQVLDLGFGAALVTTDLRYVFDQNVVWLRQAAEVTHVLNAVEEVAVQGGWPHRTIEISDQEVAAHLRPGLIAAGYAETRTLTMALCDDHPPPGDDAAAALVPIEAQLELSRALLAEEPWATTEAILDQFAERERRLAHVARAEAVIAPAEHPVSRALVLHDGGVVEIDAVMTLSQHRRQGWSSAVMGRALRVALRTRRPVVLVADQGDWPLRWYERLGFRPQGVLIQFRRWPEHGGGGSRRSG